MSKINHNCVVSLGYTLSDENGNIFEKTHKEEPLVYVQGHQILIPGFERELLGKQAGDHFKCVVQPEDGYGEMDPQLVQMLPIEEFDDIENVKPGMTFQVLTPQGKTQQVIIEEVLEKQVKANANHPLAGQVLHFDVTINGVREATAKEIEQAQLLSQFV